MPKSTINRNGEFLLLTEFNKNIVHVNYKNKNKNKNRNMVRYHSQYTTESETRIQADKWKEKKRKEFCGTRMQSINQ